MGTCWQNTLHTCLAHSRLMSYVLTSMSRAHPSTVQLMMLPRWLWITEKQLQLLESPVSLSVSKVDLFFIQNNVQVKAYIHQNIDLEIIMVSVE